MIQTLNPYPSKTDEIMSRYRPIAPKPELPLTNHPTSTTPAANGGSYDGGPLVPEKFRQSPYLRNIWSHLQARPTRTRKRGRTAGIPTVLKKQHQKMAGPGTGVGLGPSFVGLSARNLSFQAFAMYSDHQLQLQHDVINVAASNNNSNIVTLPLLSCPQAAAVTTTSAVTSADEGGERKGVAIDLNAVTSGEGALEERDLLLQLQVPSVGNNNVTTSSSTSSGVISPRPVRPVGSSISVVGPISHDPEAHAVVVKKAADVEEAAEEEALPAVISDRNNKVRMANSAYKELVGQPECPWLDSMVSSGKRISGEVMLRLSDPVVGLPVSGNGFSCWVRIEWESSDGKKNSVNAFSEVVRLECESKDYLFSWRFHTREVSPSASKV